MELKNQHSFDLEEMLNNKLNYDGGFSLAALAPQKCDTS